MKIVGIDPGKKGGVALVDTEACTVAVIPMPVEAATKGRSLTSPLLMANTLREVDPDHAFVEEVGVQPDEGAVGAFSFGRGYGRIEGVLAALHIPLTLVRPQLWKAKMGAPREKERSVARARQLMPSAAGAFVGPRGGLLDGLAEAAMIALYGALSLGLVPKRPLQHAEFAHAFA